MENGQVTKEFIRESKEKLPQFSCDSSQLEKSVTCIQASAIKYS